MHIIGLLPDNVSPDSLKLSSTGFIKHPVKERKEGRKKKRKERKIRKKEMKKKQHIGVSSLFGKDIFTLLLSIRNNTGRGVAVIIKIYFIFYIFYINKFYFLCFTIPVRHNLNEALIIGGSGSGVKRHLCPGFTTCYGRPWTIYLTSLRLSILTC